MALVKSVAVSVICISVFAVTLHYVNICLQGTCSLLKVVK